MSCNSSHFYSKNIFASMYLFLSCDSYFQTPRFRCSRIISTNNIKIKTSYLNTAKISKCQVFITAIVISLRKVILIQKRNKTFFLIRSTASTKVLMRGPDLLHFQTCISISTKLFLCCCWFQCSLHRHGSAWSGKSSVSLPGKQRCFCWGLPDIPVRSLGVRRRDDGLCTRWKLHQMFPWNALALKMVCLQNQM